MIRLLDYVFVLRPTQFFPLWMTMLSGYAVASGIALFSFEPLPLLAIFLLTVNFGAGFIFNQIVDRENDFHNNKLFLISHDHISLQNAWIEGILLTIISIVGGYWISIPFMLSAVCFTGIGILYNFLGFMNRPILGAVMNFSGGVISFVSGAYTSQVSDQSFYQLLFFSLPYGFAWAAVYLLVTLPDMEGDRMFGKRTMAVHFGIRPTLIAAFVLDALALVFSAITEEPVIFLTVGVTALISLPLFWKTLKDMNPKEIFRPVKFSMLFLAAGVTIYLPLFLLLIAANYIACRFYYQHRFGLEYPNFEKK